MKIIHCLALIGCVGLTHLFAGCESKPLTPEQKETYAKEKAVLDYENAQQANEMETLSGDGMQDGRELKP